MRTSSRFLAKQFIEPTLPVVLSVEVRHKDLDDEALIVQPTHPQTFTSKPVSVQDLVGKPIERELVEGRVDNCSSGEDTGTGPYDPVVKEMSEGKNFPKSRL